MKRCSPTPAVLFTVLLLCPAVLQGQQSMLQGHVRAEQHGAGLSGVRLLLQDTFGIIQHQAVSEPDGAFRITVRRPGPYVLVVLHDAPPIAESHPVIVPAASNVTLDVLLGQAAFRLEPISVEARVPQAERVREFRERAVTNQKMGRGRVYTRAEIEAIRPRTAESLVAGIPTGRCRPTLRLDGVPASMPDLRSITPANLEGVEIYIGNDVPRQFQEPGVCGVALVWTRTRPEGMRQMGLSRALAAGLFAAATFLLVR